MTILITNKKYGQDRLRWFSHVVALENGDGSYDILKNRFESSPNHFETENNLNSYLQDLIIKEQNESVDDTVADEIEGLINGMNRG